MAIQLGNFTPLEHKHYTLAETQSEKDEAAKRQIAIDNNRFANQAVMANMEQQNANNRANAAIRERRRQDATAQSNAEFEQDRQLGLDQARLEQQGIDNAYRDRALAANQANVAADNDRANAQLGLAQARDLREAEAFNQALQEKQQKKALAQFGSRLLSSEPDENGRVDVTDTFDVVNTLAGGGMDKGQFKRVYAQNTGDKTVLLGEGDDGKPLPVTRNGSPVAIHNEILRRSAMFAYGEPDKKQYDFKTIRGGTDSEGNILDRVARMNPQTGEVEFIDQTGRGASAQPQMTDEQKKAAFAGAVASAMKQGSKQQQAASPSLEDAQQTEVRQPSIQERQAAQQQRYQQNAARVEAQKRAEEQRAGLNNAITRIQRDNTLTRQQKLEQINALTRGAR